MKKNAIDLVMAHQWAITSEYMDIIKAVALRENEYTPEMLEKQLGRPLGNTQVTTVRDGIATIPLEGPMFARANLFTMISGGASYDVLATDFNSALNDPAVSAIILKLDTPGGEVNGASELAAMVKAAEGIKPVVVQVSGMMASAGLWIGSAASKVYASDTSMVGSLGVMMGMKVAKQGGETQGSTEEYKFISSNAPNKNAHPGTEAGAAQIQALVDGLEKVFIDTVAKNRNTTPENVAKSYGQGSVFVAAEALSRGMIDGIQTYEQTFAQLLNEVTAMDYKDLTVAALSEHRGDLVASIKAEAIAGVEKVDVAKVKAEAITAERSRITGIEALAVPGAETLIAKFKADGTEPAAAAIEIVKHVQAKGADTGAAALQAIKDAEAAAQVAATGSKTGDEGKGDEFEAFMAGASSVAGVSIHTAKK